MLWSVVLMIMTFYDIMSAFLPLLFILWPAFFYTILEVLGLKPTSELILLVKKFLFLLPSVHAVSCICVIFMCTS